MSKTILILGAGTGGIIAANELCKKAGNDGEINPVKIILFEKAEKNVFAPSLLWLMVGKRKAPQVYRNTKNLEGAGVEVVIGEIEKVSPSAISVTVKGKEYKGDYMVVSLGAEQVAEFNLNKAGFDFYSVEGASSFYEKLQGFKGGKIAIVIPSLPFKCPAAPYEAAMLINSFIHKKDLSGKTEISLFTPESGPMPVAGKALSAAVKRMIKKKGIHYFPEHQMVSATDKEMIFTNGKTAAFDLLAFTPKHQCPAVIRQTDLVSATGWIEVNRNTMETQFPNVYAIGDITFIPLEMGKPLPKAGVFAHHEAEIVAHNIVRKIHGKKPDKIFNGYGQCFLEMGDGKAGYAGGNFYGSPLPVIKIKKSGYWWHWTKVLFEKYWFFRYF